MLNRRTPALEPRISETQYAFFRGRETEMHLQGTFDCPKAGVGARHFVYLASVDIDGAFDEIPHSKFIETLLNAEGDGYILRFICAGSTRTRFKLRLLTPRGRCLSSWSSCRRGKYSPPFYGCRILVS